MKKWKSWQKLLLLFLGVFAIKTVQSLFMGGTFMYSDEACIIQKAIFFIENLDIQDCATITKAPAGDPLPFISIVISPLYLFLTNLQAYYGILVLYGLFVSSLVYPLYHIFKRFIRKEKTIFLFILVTVFLPHFSLYENMVATETLYASLVIWSLHFYLESFYKNAYKNKIRAIFFALLSSLVRPFGFITIIAITVNEFVMSKKKKVALLALIPLSVITVAVAFSFLPGIVGSIFSKFEALKDPNNILLGFEAVKNQYNSFLLGTAFIPVIIFFSYIGFKGGAKPVKSIRYFLLTYFVLNFLISANHMFGYLLKGEQLDLLTRYIHSSMIMIIMFGLVFLEKFKKYEISISNIFIVGISLLSLFFLNYQTAKHSLNLLLSNFYDTTKFLAGNTTASTDFLAYYFLPISFVLFLMLLFNKRKLLKTSIIAILIVQSIAIYLWVQQFSVNTQKNNLYTYFKDSQYKVLMVNSYKNKMIVYDYWRFLALTNNDITARYVNDTPKNFRLPDFSQGAAKAYISEYEYIISQIDLKLENRVQIPTRYYIYKIEASDD